jgi:hypothetical protein
MLNIERRWGLHRQLNQLLRFFFCELMGWIKMFDRPSLADGV